MALYIYIYLYIFSTDTEDEEMVQCCSSNCPVGWYHLTCLDPPLEEVPQGLWYCCDDCATDVGLVYCSCRKKKGLEDERMIRCARGDQCTGNERYHLSCLGLHKKDIPCN